MAVNDEKKKALDAAIAKLEKDFGKGTVMMTGRFQRARGCGNCAHRMSEP